jgi:anti-sigma factor RsiW
VATCEQVRERLPEHVLGTLEGADDDAVRRHLRGCAGCRAEMLALGDGMAAFAVAAHDRTPPDDLHDRVRTVLEEEWREPSPADELAERRRRRMPKILAVAAALALVASLGFGLAQTRRASVAAEDAASYQQLLKTLGGKDFRLGQLHAAGDQTVEGSVVVYDSHERQSWVLVFVRTSGISGEATATLSNPEGRTIDTWPIEIDRDGRGAGWLVTGVELTSFDKIEVTGPDGSLLATGTISSA